MLPRIAGLVATKGVSIIPEKMRNAPTLRPELQFYYEAFLFLGTCRQMGGMGGVGPIPWTAVDRYAISRDLDPLTREALEYHIHNLDTVYLEWAAKQVK